ncbi:MAG TPA: hypothetical protein VMW62_18105 [Chloroflexota bacterium]|nr:hypothetical protein [Chloroflexota bacterium]
MWLRVGLIAGRVLLRLLIRLAPFVAMATAGLVRRYRWPMYYRAKALKLERFSLAALPAVLLGSAGGLVVLGIALYLLVGHLSPRP